MDANRKTSNYPDLYPPSPHRDDAPSTEALRESINSKIEEVPLLPPASSMYKQIVTEQDSCILDDDIEDFANSVTTLESTCNSSTTNNTKPPVHPLEEEGTRIVDGSIVPEFSSGLWPILEFMFQQSRPVHITNINDQRTYINVYNTNPNESKHVSPSKTARIQANLKRLRSELRSKESELKSTKYYLLSKTNLENEILALKAEIKEEEAKLAAAEREEENDQSANLRLLVAGISIVVLPLIGYVSGRELGLMIYLMSLKRNERRVAERLSIIQKTQNGDLNPHFRLTQSVTSKSKKATTKLLQHTVISLLSKLAVAGGALGGIFGYWTEKNQFTFAGGLIGLLGVTVLLAEKSRYNFLEKKQVERELSEASKGARELLDIRQPFVFYSAPSYNPEYANGQ